MAFTRTSQGISNQHLFHDVDAIVFVEGGEKCFTKEEVDNGFFSDHSIDVMFWQNLFSEYHEPKTLKFKAVGSKTTVIKIAEDIVDNELVSVYAAMDKEFDEHLGNLISHKNVLYSFGYSWENDAWNENLIKVILKTLSAIEPDNAIVDKTYNNFLRDIKFGVYADAYQFSKSLSFFPRKGHLKCVNCAITSLPSLKKEEIETLISDKSLNKSTVYGYGARNQIDSKKHCYGHLFGDFCRHFITNYLRTECNLGTVDKEVIRRIVMNNFISTLCPSTSSYYRSLLA